MIYFTTLRYVTNVLRQPAQLLSAGRNVIVSRSSYSDVSGSVCPLFRFKLVLTTSMCMGRFSVVCSVSARGAYVQLNPLN